MKQCLLFWVWGCDVCLCESNIPSLPFVLADQNLMKIEICCKCIKAKPVSASQQEHVLGHDTSNAMWTSLVIKDGLQTKLSRCSCLLSIAVIGDRFWQGHSVPSIPCSLAIIILLFSPSPFKRLSLIVKMSGGGTAICFDCLRCAL